MMVYMQEASISNDLNCPSFDISIVGQILDDRGKAAVDFVRTKSSNSVTLKYYPEDFELEIEGNRYKAEEIENYFNPLKGKKIILETSTLGFTEIFLCCEALNRLKFTGFDLLYVEPKNYRSSNKNYGILSKRDFELSGKVLGYKAVPKATILLSDKVPQCGVFFLGYEERRLDRALEDFQMIQTTKCTLVFGVPAYEAGWEMDAFANNLRVIKDKNISGGIKYCGAENPLSTIRLLETIHTSLQGKERLFIAPIGTKPNGIGVALFVSNNPDVKLIYDYPQKTPGRTNKISKWHLYSIKNN